MFDLKPIVKLSSAQSITTISFRKQKFLDYNKIKIQYKSMFWDTYKLNYFMGQNGP